MHKLELLNILIASTPNNTKLEKVIEAGIYYIANAIVQAESLGADAEDLQKQAEHFIGTAIILMREFRKYEQQIEVTREAKV